MKPQDRSFKESLKNAKSFDEFFLKQDLLTELDWRVCFTQMPNTFCCGASSQCSLPKLDSKSILSATPYSVDFLIKYFNHVSSLDDMQRIHGNETLYNWYLKNSSYFYLSGLNGGNVVRQEKIVPLFSFKGIDEIKLSGQYLKSEQVINELIASIVFINNKIPIRSVAYVENNQNKSFIQVLEQFLTYIEVETVKESEEQLLKNEQTQQEDFWDEHSFYCAGKQIFMGKHESLCQSNSLGDITNLNYKQFITNLIKRKIQRYSLGKNFVEDELVKQYCEYISNNYIVNDDWNFIPWLCIDSVDKKQKLVYAGFTENQYGLIYNNEPPKMIVTKNDQR